MKIKIRTEENILTSTFSGAIAEKLLARMLLHTKEVVATDPNKKAYKMVANMGFTLTDEIQIMLYKGFYLIVE